jgi:filamentous hemagglutinin
VITRGGDALVTTASAGDTLSVTANDGSARLRNATLGPAGRTLEVRATGRAGDAVLGADPGAASEPAAGLEGAVAGAGNRLSVPAAAAIRVQGERDATVNLQNGFSVAALTAGRDAFAASTLGDARVGQVSGGRTVVAEAVQGLVVLNSAATNGAGGAQGSDITARGRGVSIATALAAGDVNVRASALDALVDSATAGGDIRVVADTGAAGLRAATVTGSLAGARELRVSGGTSATLGRAGASAPAGILSQGDAARTAVVVAAGSGDAVVDLPGDVQLTRVTSQGADAVIRATGAASVRASGGQAAQISAGRDVSVQSTGSAAVANLAAGRDGAVTSAASDATVVGARAGRNLAVNAAGGAASLSNVPNLGGTASAPAAIVVQGRTASLNAVEARQDLAARATAGSVSTTGAIRAGGDLTLQATGGTVTVGGSAAAGGALTVDSTANATLNTVSGRSVLVRATDVALGGSLVATGTSGTNGTGHD